MKLNEAKFENSDLRQKLTASGKNPTRYDQSLGNYRFDPRLYHVTTGAIRAFKDEFLQKID